MSVYKRPGSKYYWSKFELNGKRIHKSTKTTNLTKALQWEAALRTQMQRVLVGLERETRRFKSFPVHQSASVCELE